MPYRITNRTNETVLVRLLSGRTIHLGAGAHTDDLDGAELNGNPRLSSLLERQLVTVEDTTPGGSATTTKKQTRTASGRSTGKSESSEGGTR